MTTSTENTTKIAQTVLHRELSPAPEEVEDLAVQIERIVSAKTPNRGDIMHALTEVKLREIEDNTADLARLREAIEHALAETTLRNFVREQVEEWRDDDEPGNGPESIPEPVLEWAHVKLFRADPPGGSAQGFDFETFQEFRDKAQLPEGDYQITYIGDDPITKSLCEKLRLVSPTNVGGSPAERQSEFSQETHLAVGWS